MMLTKILAKIAGLLRWFFGAPVSELPPAFGDIVPSDMRVFEEQVQHFQEMEQPKKQYASQQHAQTKPPKRDVPLERM